MSVYGDLSKAQRALLTSLSRSGAVSIGTALEVDPRGRMTAKNLKAKGLVNFGAGWRPPVWLTAAGVSLMKSLDFRHVGGSRGRA